MVTSLPHKGSGGHQLIRIAWIGDDVLFWQGAKALLSSPQFRLQPAQVWAGHKVQPETIDLLIWDLATASQQALATFQDAWPDIMATPVLIVCAHMDEVTFNTVHALGVQGVLSKQIDGQYLVQSIKQVVAGQKVWAPEFRSFLPNTEALLFETLTVREREILTYLAKGVSNKVIAEALSVAPSTVKVHVQNILRKLQLTSRVQAAVYAVRQQN